MRTLILCGLLAAGLSGCGLIYKVNVQQGNILEREQAEELREGMSKRQVSLILGTPAVQDPFHQDRWDYVTSFKQRGEVVNLRKLVVEFENDRLVSVGGDYFEQEILIEESALEEATEQKIEQEKEEETIL